MNEVFHGLCNSTSNLVHAKWSDRRCFDSYRSGMTTKEESGRRIKRARQSKGMTLDQVCISVPGLTVSRLSNWEQGTRMIGVDEAKRLAPALGVTAGYLLTLEDAPEDQRESALLDLYRHSDDRGKEMIIRVAESESRYAVDESYQPQRSA